MNGDSAHKRAWIVAGGAVVAAALTAGAALYMNRSEVSAFKARAQELADRNQDLARQVDKLQIELAPFAALAAERHPGQENAALEQLASEMSQLSARCDDRDSALQESRLLRAELSQCAQQLETLRAQVETQENEPKGGGPSGVQSAKANAPFSAEVRGVGVEITKLQVLQRNRLLVRARISNDRPDRILISLDTNKDYNRNNTSSYPTYVVDNLNNQLQIQEVVGITTLRRGDQPVSINPGQHVDASFYFDTRSVPKLGSEFEFSTQLAVLEEDAVGEARVDRYGDVIPQESISVLVDGVKPVGQ